MRLYGTIVVMVFLFGQLQLGTSATLSTGQKIPDPPDSSYRKLRERLKEKIKTYRLEDSGHVQEVTFEHLEYRKIRYSIRSESKKWNCAFKLAGKASYVPTRKKEFRTTVGADYFEKVVSIYLGQNGDCSIRIEQSEWSLAFSTVNCPAEGECARNSIKLLKRVLKSP